MDKEFVLHLYITGSSPNSVRAVSNLRHICEEYLSDRYDLQIIDVYQEPETAILEKMVALPMLIKKFPLPEKRMIGDMSQTKKVLKGLGIESGT